MEAGAANGPAGGDAGAQDAPQQADGQVQQQQPDAGPQLGDVMQQLEQMRGWMEDNVAAQPYTQDPTADQQFPDQPPQPPDLGFIDPSNPAYDPQQAAGLLLQHMQEQQQQQLQQALAPIQQQVQDVQNSREADALAAEFPDLQQPEVAERVFKATADWVQAAGLPQEAAGNMQVIRAVYMMGRAADLANSENEQQVPDPATLEGGGGASPGAGTGGQFTAESIIGAQRRSPLPF